MEDKFDKILKDKIKEVIEHQDFTYNPEHWEVNVMRDRPKGMSVPEPICRVEFNYLHGNILIQYGEEKSQVKNRDKIIEMIKLL